MADQTDADRLAAANDILIGAVENGPWVLIPDPDLRQMVGEYVADTCHSIAAAAGLDEAMERAHDGTPQRLATALPDPQCTATYPEAPEHDRRCVQPEGHQPAVALHFNKAGFAWSDGEVLSAVVVDARERLARHLFVSERGDEWAAREWDLPQHVNQEPYLRRADALLAVITGKSS